MRAPYGNRVGLVSSKSIQFTCVNINLNLFTFRNHWESERITKSLVIFSVRKKEKFFVD